MRRPPPPSSPEGVQGGRGHPVRQGLGGGGPLTWSWGDCARFPFGAPPPPPPPSLHSVHLASGASFRGGLSLCAPPRAAGQLQVPSSPPPAIHRAPDQPFLGGAPSGGSGHRGRRARPGCLAGPAVLEASERAEVSEGRAARTGGAPDGLPPPHHPCRAEKSLRSQELTAYNLR